MLAAVGAFDGKVALITGAASGIGRATAERLVAEGAAVCIVDLVEDAGREVANRLGGSFHSADVGEPHEVQAAFAHCEREHGGVDIAFLNAGIAIAQPDIEMLTDDEYRRIMRVNVDGVVFGTRAAVPAMARRGGGAIVATSSLAGIIPFPPDPVYDLTKHAVVGFIRSIAPALERRSITANCVNPGMTDTPLLGAEAKQALEGAGFPIIPAPQIAEAVATIIASGRTGECWVCQPGREAMPYRFRQVPGPRTEGDRGKVPPNITAGENRWKPGA
jgi:NAD(P)-dependent dehydrogenase (short-subunit alcohol dehydrogenase family)